MEPKAKNRSLKSDPQWYKDAIVYEVHVRAFLDSNADGIGDFPGLTQKLDYLRDLGATAIWLLPFYPSPLKDDGYDIADYYSINPIYGTLADFRRFLDEAHARDLRVITELVVNHTSDQHPWFQRARRAPPGSDSRNLYVWSDSPEKYKTARIIFRDFEPSNWTWDRVANAYFWHRFYSHQPDLNFDNPAVHAELLRVLDFWLDMGVDGLRLDAVPYLYEREGTSCENLPETHEYLKKLRKHVDERYADRMLLAEANQWPEDSVAYFGGGKGDECHMAFHFPLMPRIFMSVRMEDRVPIVDILEQTPPIPETSQWAVFLRNHDELTLEMVTDEERDYMYRVYANDLKARINLGIRRRLAPLLGNNRRLIELLNLLLFSYPGTPFLYYGDEIGLGDNIYLGDRDGVRTPMQWSSDKNAGFSRAHPHALYLPISMDPEYHYEAVNVEAQQSNPHSLWWWTRRTLSLRKRYKAFGRGTIEFLAPANRKILAFVRRFEEETILVVANLSRFAQYALLDLQQFHGRTPLELFGRSEFPVIGETPYSLTLSPHACFWFSLEATLRKEMHPACGPDGEVLQVAEDWQELLPLGNSKWSSTFETCLSHWLQQRRWFAGKDRQIRALQILDSVQMAAGSKVWRLLLLQVEFIEGDPQEYFLPIAFASGEELANLLRERPELFIVRLRIERGGIEGGLYEATGSKEWAELLLDSIREGLAFRGASGELRAAPGNLLQAGATLHPAERLEPVSGNAEQTNSSIIFGYHYFLKLYRKVEPGINPDLELGRFLTAKGFQHIAPVLGWIEYDQAPGQSLSIGILTTYYPHAKDSWEFTLESLSRYFERVRSWSPETLASAEVKMETKDLTNKDLPEPAIELLGTYIEAARLLGARTAELHLALASDLEDPDFSPEPFTPFYQRGLFQSMRNLTVRNLQALHDALPKLPKHVRDDAAKLLQAQPEILNRFHAVHRTLLSAKRIRCHGDFHLGQVLYTGKDFIIIDFEGEPARALGERRLKRSPLRDVAGMVRSFDYASHTAAAKQLELGLVQESQREHIRSWARVWYRCVSAVYLRSYLEVVRPGNLFPHSEQELDILLFASLLEKAIYELGYELNNRPDWLHIPIYGILELLGEPGTTR